MVISLCDKTTAIEMIQSVCFYNEAFDVGYLIFVVLAPIFIPRYTRNDPGVKLELFDKEFLLILLYLSNVISSPYFNGIKLHFTTLQHLKAIAVIFQFIPKKG